MSKVFDSCYFKFFIGHAGAIIAFVYGRILYIVCACVGFVSRTFGV